jgi:hypothetical protein
MTEDEFINEEDVNNILAKFIEEGIVEVHGIDSYTGDFTYKLTPKAAKVFPELYEEHFAFVNELAFVLWEKGYIEMKFEDDGPRVMLKDIDYQKEVFPLISQEERHFIENMLYLHENKDDII